MQFGMSTSLLTYDPGLIGELIIHVLFFATYVKQVEQITNKNHEVYYYLQYLFHFMSNKLN